MAGVKLVVIYPRPKDIAVFEKLYQEEHVPMAVDKLAGKTKFVATKVLATPDGTPPPLYRIAEVHFPSLEALQACAQSAGGKETVAHAVKISSGGAPIFLVAEEQTFMFGNG
ncbi:MAG: EthD family reductase [Methylocella sp.]